VKSAMADSTQKPNKNWESSDDDMDSVEDDGLELSQEEEGALGGPLSGGKRMGEDKLQEKRLKERARRNGMASSIDEMRVLVPELIDAKKNYSQAKVVALALGHIYDLQRENELLRSKLGMKPMLDEFRERQRLSGGKVKARTAPAAGATRGRKRRRLLEQAQGSSAPVAVAAPPAPTVLAAPSPLASALAALPKTVKPMAIVKPELNVSVEHDDDTFVADSLVSTPALSPHHNDDLAAPFAPNFENFESFDAHRTHAMEWAEHDVHDTYHSTLQFESFLDH